MSSNNNSQEESAYYYYYHDGKRYQERIRRPQFPIWVRISRIIFGKIKRLPHYMTTTLVLFSVHMYLTVPVIIAAGITSGQQQGLKALLRPFRLIYEQGFHFEELGAAFSKIVE